MNILRDRNTETSGLYQSAMMAIGPILDEKVRSGEVTPENYWETKKELLRQRGIDWKTPGELNPEITRRGT